MAKTPIIESIKERVRLLAKASSELADKSSQLGQISRLLRANSAKNRAKRAEEKAARELTTRDNGARH